MAVGLRSRSFESTGRLLLILFLSFAPPLSAAPSETVPLPTGSHFEFVRIFMNVGPDGSGEEVKAIAGTYLRGFYSTGRPESRVQPTERLGRGSPADAEGPAGVGELFSPSRDFYMFAGAPDGVWTLTEGKWRLEVGSPRGVIAFAEEPDGTPWALSREGAFRRSGKWALVHSIDPDDMKNPRSILPRGPEDALVASESGLFALTGKRKYWLPLEVRPEGLPSGDTRALLRLDAAHFLVTTDRGFTIGDGMRGWRSVAGAEGLPILDLTHAAAAKAPDGSLTTWLGGPRGLVQAHGGRFRYFAGKRWLPDDRVTALAADPDGSVWVGTAKGLTHIYPRTLTLEEKAKAFQETIPKRFYRHGYVTVMILPAPGVVEGARQEISDNDGLWTALYIAAQSLRFAATKAAHAQAQASRSMEALLRLESLTGIPGFPARAVCRRGEPEYERLRANPEWNPSPVEKEWIWKGDTSSDEIDGHYFGWYVFHELAASEEEKARVRATCKRVTDHILDHGLHLVDLDGKPTTWGVWAPEKLNDDPKWWEERGLNSLEILSHLRVAIHLTGEERYERAYRELIEKHRYAINTLEAKVPGGVSHDDQLLFLACYPLLMLEKDPGLRTLYLASLERTWGLERIEANPLWNFIYGALTGRPCDVEAAVETLREIPLDLIRWRVTNSHRADLKFDPELEKRGVRRLLKPLPFPERAINNWDAEPRQLDGGNDQGEGDPTIYLLPYWMGRHHKIIE